MRLRLLKLIHHYLACSREESHLLVVLQSAVITPNFITTFVFLFVVFSGCERQLITLRSWKKMTLIVFFQWDNTPLANTFSEIDSFGFHIRLPGSVKAIYYILCFRGWTLIIFWTGPWTSGISQNNPKTGLKTVISIEHFSFYYRCLKTRPHP